MFSDSIFSTSVFVDTADLPWLDLKRKKVGKANKTTIAVRRMRLMVKLLTPSSEDVKAKINLIFIFILNK